MKTIMWNNTGTIYAQLFNQSIVKLRLEKEKENPNPKGIRTE